jgi:CRP-like cAMP-binding protein
MQPIESIGYRNMVLRSMLTPDIERLAPYLSLVSLARYQDLTTPGRPIQTVYFLEDGISCVVATMANGTTVEVGLIGFDGFVGLPAILGTTYLPNRYVIQIAGYGYRVDSRILTEQLDASPTLRRNFMRSVQGQLVQTAQTAACNRIHDLPRRLARWLLMCHNRVQSDQIELTQELLATMLGTQRSSVTVAANALQRLGLITYTRGRVTINHRVGLERAACECYRVVHAEFVRLGLLP